MPSKIFPMSEYEVQNCFHVLQEHLVQQGQTVAQLSEALEHITQDVDKNWTQLLALKTEVQALSGILNALQTELEAERVQNKQNIFSQVETAHNILIKLDSICSAIFSKEQPIDVRFERGYYRDFPTPLSGSSPDFQTDFLSLTEHLDVESIETISLALNRLHAVQQSADEWMALYSAEEKKEMQQIKEHFFNAIITLSSDCFYYNGYLLPINHFEPCVFWNRCGLSYLNHPERLSELDIIDAGAFIGDSALIFSELTTGNIHAFEPVPDNYQYMIKTIRLNKKKNITPNLAALGDHCGKLTVSINDSSSSHFQNSAVSYKGQVEADMLTVDGYVDEHKLNIGLIKADVEGAEQILLSGALKTIKAQKPALLISIYHNADDFFHIKPILEKLDLGYRFKIRHPICGSVLTETLLIAEVD